MIRVKTKAATYVVDRERNRWMRISEAAPRIDDGDWIEGGFTLGEIGQRCFAHFASHPDGAAGRRTSDVVAIVDEGAAP